MTIKLIHKIEAVLFLETDSISIDDLAGRLEIKKEDCQEELNKLKEKYGKNSSALDLVMTKNQVQLVVKKELASFIKEYFQKQTKNDQLTPAMLEVLSVVLYKGPVGKAGIEQIRGVNCGLILRKLLVKGFIDREEQVENSRIFIYKPSLKLLKKLGISQLENLPDYDKLSGELNLNKEI